jgi:hypothetical protein
MDTRTIARFLIEQLSLGEACDICRAERQRGSYAALVVGEIIADVMSTPRHTRGACV